MKTRPAVPLALFAVVLAALVGAASSGQDAGGTVWDGVYTAEQAARGEPLYVEGCAECHGPELLGDDMSPPLIGADFLWAWNELSLADLFERIRISMPDGDSSSMSPQEKADVLAYMLRENEIPAGENEIAPRAEPLRPIQFVAVAP